MTTSSIADPSLTLSGGAIKIFTAFCILIGIGILVELVRQIGFGYVAMRSDKRSARHDRRHKNHPAAPSPPPDAAG